MQPFRQVTGIAVPFNAKNVDTDVIIPSRWLKVVTRTGLGAGAFEAIRQDPANIFDMDRYRGAPILIAGENFGCGSSREHAPWALLDMGFRVVIAPSFADIFASNSFKNGLLLVTLPQEEIDQLLATAQAGPLTVDLERQRVTDATGSGFGFAMDPFRRQCLLDGLDEIALTGELAAELDAYDARLRLQRPWIAQNGR